MRLSSIQSDFSSRICHVDDIRIFNVNKTRVKSSEKMQIILEFLEFKGPLVNDDISQT